MYMSEQVEIGRDWNQVLRSSLSKHPAAMVLITLCHPTLRSDEDILKKQKEFHIFLMIIPPWSFLELIYLLYHPMYPPKRISSRKTPAMNIWFSKGNKYSSCENWIKKQNRIFLSPFTIQRNKSYCLLGTSSIRTK